MDAIYCHFFKPCKTEKGPFQAASMISNPRKFTRNKLWITEVRTSIQVSYLYLRAPSGRACQTTSECGRQAGGEDAFGVPTGIFPLPPRAAALAPLCGYPMSKYDKGGNRR